MKCVVSVFTRISVQQVVNSTTRLLILCFKLIETFDKSTYFIVEFKEREGLYIRKVSWTGPRDGGRLSNLAS